MWARSNGTQILTYVVRRGILTNVVRRRILTLLTAPKFSKVSALLYLIYKIYIHYVEDVFFFKKSVLYYI